MRPFGRTFNLSAVLCAAAGLNVFLFVKSGGGDMVGANKSLGISKE